MFVDAAIDRALNLISDRASDVYRAFTPGAVPSHGDVATDAPRSHGVFDPMSVSAPADDYFVLGNASGRVAYTRDGRLTLANGAIAGANGERILGYAKDESAVEPLTVDPVDDTLGRISNLRVEGDGSVVYDRRVIDPRSGSAQQQRVCVGRLALARFPAGTKMTSTDGISSSPPPGVVAHLGRPGDGNFGSVTPMRREASRVDFDRSLDRLHDAYVAFDALQAAHKAQGHAGKVAMDLLK